MSLPGRNEVLEMVNRGKIVVAIRHEQDGLWFEYAIAGAVQPDGKIRVTIDDVWKAVESIRDAIVATKEAAGARKH